MHKMHFRCKIPITTINPKLMMINLKSRTLSSSSITQLAAPTHDDIIQLILDQKTASQAFQTFNWASKLPNFTHNQSTYRVLIHKLCTLCRFSDARQVLDEMPHSIGSPPEEGVFITFIRGLGRGKRIKDVILMPDLMRKFGVVPSLKVYNAILDVLVKEDIDIAKGFYRRKMMMEGGINGDNYTFGILMKGLCLTNRVGDGFKLLQVMKGKGVTPNTVIYNTMLHNLCKNGNVVKAKRLMSLMEERSDVTYNLMISAYCKEGNAVQAQMLLEEGFASGCVPDAVATTKVIDLLCNAGRVNDAADLLERVEKRGAVIDVVAYNTLIKGFCSIGKAQHGLHFKKQMEKKGFLPNVETYNILIDGFCSMGMLDRAMGMFDEMKQSAINRNFITFNTLIKGFCSKGKVDDAFKILELMEETKLGSDGHICPYNSIIYGLYRENRVSEALDFLNKMSNKFPRAVRRTLAIVVLCKDGNIESAKEVYEKMLHEGGVPSVLVYDNLINCFSRHNRFDEGVKLMNEMVDRGYTPVASTYDTAISGFSDPAEIASALKCTEEMEKKGYSLDVGSYSPLILALCNAGDLEKAFKFLQQMVDKGIGPDYSTWISMVYCLNRKTKWCEPNNLSSIDNRIQLIVET